MGIRFRCHHCEHELHVKDFQAGKRGRCPECRGTFRVPLADAPHSLDIATDTLEGSQSEVEAGETEPVPSQEAVWYVRPPSGGQYGPANRDVLEKWLEERRITADTLLWCTGWEQWRPAQDSFPEHFREAIIPPGQRATLGETSAPPPSMNEHANLNEVDFHEEITAPTPVAKTSTTASPAQESEALPASTGSARPSLSERNRLDRRQRKKRNYFITLTLLSVLAVVLIIALVIALMIQ